MKHFMIRYRFKEGSREEWHQAISRFIDALEAEPTLQGRIAYRCSKARNDSDEYYHLAAAADEEAVKALQANAFFKPSRATC